MINFKEIPMSEELHNMLDNVQVDFVYQPIYRAADKKLVAYEALMRPVSQKTSELIEECRATGKLHLVELITTFGAFKGYFDREYDVNIHINSFPEECMTDEEEEILHNCFPGFAAKMIVEILEYTNFDYSKWKIKQAQSKRRDILIAIDDYGTGNNNDMAVIDIFEPVIIKISQTIISGIHKNPENQKIFKGYIEEFHQRGLYVLAEGVECKEDVDYVIKNGVDFLQGFYLGAAK